MARLPPLSVRARLFLYLVAVLAVADLSMYWGGLAADSHPPPAPVHAPEPGHTPVVPANPEELRPPPPGPPPGSDREQRNPPPPGFRGPPPDGPRPPRHPYLVLAIQIAVLLPLTWLLASGLAGPLALFSERAATSTQPVLDAAGRRSWPPEIRAAAEAFEAMRNRLNTLLRERTQMVAAIAHDLRTPLTRLAFRLDDQPSPLGERARADIEEMRLMIASALDFIRDRSREGPVERLDFRLLVERVVEELADIGRPVTLAPGESVIIKGVPLTLRRMVSNLVDNAIKYGQCARVSLVARSGDCLLQIDDDGPGIAPGLQERVFEPFFRIEASRNRETGGTGLGLATVRAIVIEHGGGISLANRAEGGLRVSVRFPLA